ncbi:hypothetical protein Noda2021_03760 [Candidatus Dependentiae bacterium Noda2021]|nr:hypothetical protein Noda2021_03760 [Candidatus Dependentiae bacterium Noda2021]
MIVPLYLLALSILFPLSIIACPTCSGSLEKNSPPFFLQAFPEDQLFSSPEHTQQESATQFTTEDGL